MQSVVGVQCGTCYGEVARFAIDADIFQLVDQGNVEGECVEPHAANTREELALLGVVLLMRVAVGARDLWTLGKTTKPGLANPLVVALVRPVRCEPKTHSLLVVEVAQSIPLSFPSEVEGDAVARKLSIFAHPPPQRVATQRNLQFLDRVFGHAKTDPCLDQTTCLS